MRARTRLSFEIDDTSGQIKTKTDVTYDHETTPSYSVTVKADDKNGGTDTIVVTITVTNVDEDGTVILSTNQPTARAQVTATLTDPDGVTGTTTWLWAKSSDGNTDWANVGTNSPSYTTVDGDVGSYLRATASYTDGHGPSKSANAQTTQKVGAGTNRAPEFGATTDTREVAEKTAAGQPVGAAVTANDPDNGDTLTYSMSGGDAGLFDFDTGTGQIKVKAGTTLDYEGTRKSYTVAIEVTDGKDADGASNPAMDDSIAVTINVTDVDEAGTVALSMTQPSVPYTTHRHIDRPGWQCHQRNLAVGQGRCPGRQLFRHNRCYVKYLHARRRRRGQVPKGQSFLYRRRSKRQDRGGGIGQSCSDGSKPPADLQCVYRHW